MPIADALWIDACRSPVLRPVEYSVGAGHVEIETLYSAVSRGTERLVFEGRVPPTEHERMRAPYQQGGFEFPVKYGYSTVGRIVSDAPEARRTVFCLHPHQSRFAVPRSAVSTVPDGVPAARAVLAANMETALNVVWDSGLGPGDRVAVVGAGVIGALVGRLAARMPGTEVELIDIQPSRRDLAAALGCAFAPPEHARGSADVIVHASASAAGLSLSLDLAGPEATVVEASWYGTGDVAVPLGGAFHSQRLRLVASQVGRIPPARAPRWNHARRMALVMTLLDDPVLDALFTGETAFRDLPAAYAGVLDDPQTLCHRVRYLDN